jgi:MFS family permease
MPSLAGRRSTGVARFARPGDALKGWPSTPPADTDQTGPATAQAQAVPDAPAAAPRRKRIFYGWWIVGAGSVTNALGGSLHWQGFQVLFLPVAASLDLSHAQTALAFSLARAENAITGPITGWVIDRYGVRPLMIAGTVVAGIGYVLLAAMDTYLSFLLIYLFVVSIGGSLTFMQATTTALNTWFIRRRGLATSINSAAFRLGSAFTVPLLSAAVLAYGWQSASMWVGAFMIVAIAPLGIFFKRSPESIGERPDGGPIRRAVSAQTAGQAAGRTPAGDLEDDSHDWGVKEALKTRAFWVLALGTVLRMSAHGAVFVHLIAILVSKGQGQQTAANMVGIMAVVSVPLILLAGWASDRLSRQKLLAVCYAASGASLLLLVLADGFWPLMVALFLFTGTEAGASLNWAMVGDLFGRKKYATIRGMLAPMFNGALVITPVAAGWVFDRTGSYNYALVAGAGLFAAAAVTFLLLKRPTRTAAPAGAAP